MQMQRSKQLELERSESRTRFARGSVVLKRQRVSYINFRRSLARFESLDDMIIYRVRAEVACANPSIALV